MVKLHVTCIEKPFSRQEKRCMEQLSLEPNKGRIPHTRIYDSCTKKKIVSHTISACSAV